MKNNLKNRSEFFGARIVAYEGELNEDNCKLSYVDGVLTHIDSLTANEATGYTWDGKNKGWFAAKRSFGILAVDDNIARADHQIALEENNISRAEKYVEFIESHDKNTLYPIYDFFEWYRRFTGACYAGRIDFLKRNHIDMEGACTALFFLDITDKQGWANDLMKELKEYYKGGPMIYEAANPGSAVQGN